MYIFSAAIRRIRSTGWRFGKVALFMIVASVAFIQPAAAENAAYRITNSGRAHFQYHLAGILTRGFIPIESAGLLLDLDAPENAVIHVNFDVSKARAGNLFATAALKEPRVLSTSLYPSAHFVSSSVLPNQDGVLVRGQFTLRGQTRTLDLDITLAHDGRDMGEPSVLRVRGQFDRRDFGAGGYPDLVDPIIRLDFELEIEKL